MTRLCFVGQYLYFSTISLSQRNGDITPSFIEYKEGDDVELLLNRLKETSPDITIFFRPETIPSGTLKNVSGLKVGWFTEPISRSRNSLAFPYWRSSAQKDLERRRKNLVGRDFAQFDKFISFDPLIADSLSAFVDIWRSLPLPVDDKFFTDIDLDAQARVTYSFLGRPTKHRDKFLTGKLLHEFNIVYMAHGAQAEILQLVLRKSQVGINLHNENYPNFENRVPLHLASGHLLISEPLSPSHGLEEGIDFLSVRRPQDLCAAINEAEYHLSSFDLMRQRGRQKAEYFRASAVYSKILNEI